MEERKKEEDGGRDIYIYRGGDARVKLTWTQNE